VFAVRDRRPHRGHRRLLPALRDQNYSGAHDLRCSAFKAQISEPDFAKREGERTRKQIDINGFDRHNDSARPRATSPDPGSTTT
jgi:hypothetical protein